jgi:hypothetical protein
MRLRGRVLDLAERVEVLEADIVRLDRASKKLRGTVTGGIRKDDEPAIQPDLSLIADEDILTGKVSMADA